MDAQRCVSKHERVYARLPTRYVAAPVLRNGRAQPRWKNVPARRAPSSGRGRSEIRSEDARVNTTHYPAAGVSQQIETHTLSVLVDNEPGVLARVIGLFSGRGYNIDSLTVSETEHERHLSRITIVTRGTPMVIEQIKNQLERLVPIDRELAMVKVRGKGEHRMEALRLADAFRARVIDASTESFVFEITGASEKIESFVALMIPLGLVEVSRTGIVAIARGSEGM